MLTASDPATAALIGGTDAPAFVEGLADDSGDHAGGSFMSAAPQSIHVVMPERYSVARAYSFAFGQSGLGQYTKESDFDSSLTQVT